LNVAIIPARGGSKRIPRKNIRDFCGKPMMGWPIAAAQESALFDHIIISTDDDEIAEVADALGAEVPFRRPAELANDHAGTTEVVAHATEWAMQQGWPIAAVCCLYATAPFVTAEDLRAGLKLLVGGDWAFSFTATDYGSPIFRAFLKDSNGGVEMLFPEHFAKRSQDLPTAMHDAGQFYWGRPESWLTQERLFDRWSTPLIIPRWRVQDIDTEDDWIRAELMWKAMLPSSGLLS
jgi:N-acylneuraminate cytidylyltransferase